MHRLQFGILTEGQEPNTTRLGTLTCNGLTIETPAFVGGTSRGVTPHITPDLVERHTALLASYVALEDFFEKDAQELPLFSPNLPLHAGSRLRSFTACSDRQLLIAGARRSPPVPSPRPNTDGAIYISTSLGFRKVPMDEYVRAAVEAGADILIGPGDIAHGEKSGRRRLEKMFSRTEHWIQELAAAVSKHEQGQSELRQPAVFAPVLPVEVELQRWYFDLLGNELKDAVSGLAIYDRSTAAEIPESLAELPRLSLTEASRPQQLLQELSHGVDLFTIPFVAAATDAGVALDFCFPPPNWSGGEQIPLGTDMWTEDHATSTSGLSSNCSCYACQRHSRAYVRHLLSAKEMLAWVLLQIHNIHVTHDFFEGVRRSMREGRYEADASAFEAAYQDELPAGSGPGPRVRGYQIKSEGPGEAKKNPSAFTSSRGGATSSAGAPHLTREVADDLG